MPVPWVRILDGVLGLSDVVRRVRPRADIQEQDQLTAATRAPGALEARLAGVVVAALKEAFDRDHQRLELERQQLEAERQRTERALRSELLRQSVDREIGRLRLLAALAGASWLGTLFFAAQSVDHSAMARVALGLGWLLLLGALGAAFSAQARVGHTLSSPDDRSFDVSAAAGPLGAAAPWLLVAGLAVIAFGILLA